MSLAVKVPTDALAIGLTITLVYFTLVPKTSETVVLEQSASVVDELLNTLEGALPDIALQMLKSEARQLKAPDMSHADEEAKQLNQHARTRAVTFISALLAGYAAYMLLIARPSWAELRSAWLSALLFVAPAGFIAYAAFLRLVLGNYRAVDPALIRSYLVSRIVCQHV